MDIEFFETKKISCGTKAGPVEYTILLQNENGPCPLVALVNTLILTEQHVTQKDGSVQTLAGFTQGKDKVSVNGILEQLGDLLVEKDSAEGSSNGVQDTSHVDDVLTLLPKLVTGLNINVRFNGTFENTPEMELFRIYDVDIVHGWVCDPEDPEYELINQVGSYDEAQSVILRDLDESDHDLHAKAEAVQHFMQNNATQLTNYGLSQLRELLSTDSPSVLFRNDHFATIIVRNNCLYTLVADQGYKDKPRVVWQALSSVDGADDAFYDGNFNSHLEQEEQQQQQQQNEQDKDQTDKDDYMLARELQMAEDSQLAQQLAAPRNTNASTRGGRERDRERRRDQGRRKKDRKCTIM